MLMPKKVKHRKQMRGRMTGTATRGADPGRGVRHDRHDPAGAPVRATTRRGAS